MKKLISVLLVFVMMLASMTTLASATDESSIELSALEKSKISLLYRMDIIDSEDVTDANVTRGEFASWVAAVAGAKNVSVSSSRFSDVDPSSAYAGAIEAVYAMGCMNGVSNSEFGVATNISVQDAAVALIRVLGYEAAAQKNGGYPAGYAKVAATTNLYKNVRADKLNARAAIMQMCYNALTIPYVDYTGKRQGSILLEAMHGVYKERGVVSGNRFTKLDTEKMILATDEIEINGRIYKTEDVSFANYLGESVIYYYYVDGDYRYLVYLEPETTNEEVIVVEAKDITYAQNNVIKYTDEDDEEEIINLTPGFDYVVNNRVVLDRTTSDLWIEDGNLTFIDSDGDEVYDFVKATKIETMIYQSIDAVEARIYCREGYIYTNPFKDEYYFSLIKVDERTGEHSEMELDELLTGDILTVYRSNDEKYTVVYAYTPVEVVGVVDEVNDAEVIIDGVSYDFPLKTAKEEIIPGYEVKFTTDMFGRLVSLEDSSSEFAPKYGYFFAYDAPKGLARGKIKILDGESSLVFDLAEQVKVDGVSTYSNSNFETCTDLFSGGVATRQLIKYSLNAKGELRAIYTMSGSADDSIVKASDISKDASVTYYPWYKIWAKRYIQSDDTFFMVVPTYGDEGDNEELYSNTYKFADYTNTVYCEIFDVTDRMDAGAIILYINTSLEGTVALGQNSKVGVVISTSRGAENSIIRVCVEGETTAYQVEDKYVDVSPFAPGDVARFETNVDGKIVALEMLLNVGTTGENTPVPELSTEGTCEYYFGRVYDYLEDYIVIVPNVNNPGYDNAITNRLTVPTANARNIMVVNMAGKSVKASSASTSSVARYFDDEEGGACYVYTRVYLYERLFDLIIYKF